MGRTEQLLQDPAGRRWSRRRTWLVILASFNLAVWIGIAAVLGIVASDMVDLGIESYVRQQQATAVAAVQRASTRLSEAREPKAPPPADNDSAAAELQVQSGAGSAADTSGSTSDAATSAGGLAGPSLGGNADLASDTQAQGSNLQPLAPPAAVPPVSRPLLLADPMFTDLSDLDAELARSAMGRTVQIRYQQDALNREIQALLRDLTDLPYRDVHVELRPDQVLVTGNVAVLGFQLQAEIVAKVVAEGCLPQTRVEAASIAGIAAPRFLREGIVSLLGEAMSWYPPDYPLCVERIVLEEGRATIYGHRR